MIHRFLRLTANGRVNYQKVSQEAWVRFTIKARSHAKEYDEAYRKHLKWLHHPSLFGGND